MLAANTCKAMTKNQIPKAIDQANPDEIRPTILNPRAVRNTPKS